MLGLGKRREAGEAGHSASLGTRIHAWWEGSELPAADEAEADADDDLSSVPEDAPAAEAAPRSVWKPERIHTAQRVWGDGFIGPLDGADIITLMKPLALDESKQMVDLGAGLGGPARAVAAEFGVWVTGYEVDEALAAEGMEQATIAGYAKKAPVHRSLAADLRFDGAKYDCVFSKETLFTLEDKAGLLARIDKGLKAQGALLITDYVLREEGVESDAITTWRVGEPVPPQPWSSAQYRSCCAELKLDIRVCEDMTEQFNDALVAGWRGYRDRLGTRRPDPAFVDSVVAEADLWARRSAALCSGDLKIIRLHALKRAH